MGKLRNHLDNMLRDEIQNRLHHERARALGARRIRPPAARYTACAAVGPGDPGAARNRVRAKICEFGQLAGTRPARALLLIAEVDPLVLRKGGQEPVNLLEQPALRSPLDLLPHSDSFRQRRCPPELCPCNATWGVRGARLQE